MTQATKLYPIGIQTFEKIRNGNYLYIDKTEIIYRLTHAASNYVFLSRPRRFGKSLLTSTLKAYFEGRRDLFKGLAMERLETEWTEYPVLHFDMSLGKHMEKEQLERYLLSQLEQIEEDYGIHSDSPDSNIRLTKLIRHVYEQTGRQAVVLIDEYDAPLLDVVHEEKNLPVLRNIMRNFYSPLKACDPYLRFVFLTGITKFSQLSIFSELNNIQNISMLPEYAAICGITEEEMDTQMDEDLDILAKRMGISHEEAVQKLKYNYDGYHFTWPSPDIYNPFSLLNAFADGRLDSYWFGSGTPTYLIEMLKKYGVLPSKIGGNEAMAEEFDAPTERMASITPLLPKRIRHHQGRGYGLRYLPARHSQQGSAHRIDAQPPSLLCHTRHADGHDHNRQSGPRLGERRYGRHVATPPDFPFHRALLRPYGLRRPLSTDALYHFQPLGHVCGCGSEYPEGTGGHGDAHGHYALHRGAEIEPIRRSRHAAN